MFDVISDSCRYLLLNFPEAHDARSYLSQRIDAITQERFQFGYFPDNHNLSALTSLIGNDTLQKYELAYIKKIEDMMSPRQIVISYFEHHPIIIPFRDVYGEIIGIVGRTLHSSDDMKTLKISKYKNTSDKHCVKFKKGNHLFGLFENKEDIIKQNSVFLVEGQFDVIKAYESGFRNVVALSNSNMTSYQFSLINRYTDNIFLLLDNDEAGEKGRKRILEMFGRFANIKNFYLPYEYKDIDEYLSHNKYENLSLVIKD